MIRVAEDVHDELGDLAADHERARALVETTPFAGHAAARFRLDDQANAEQLDQLRRTISSTLDELEESLQWAQGQEADAQADIARWERDHDEWVQAHNP